MRAFSWKQSHLSLSISFSPPSFLCGIDEHTKDIVKDINVKNTRNVKSEAPPDTAFLSEYRKLPFLSSSPFILERLCTRGAFFPPPFLPRCGNGSRALLRRLCFVRNIFIRSNKTSLSREARPNRCIFNQFQRRLGEKEVTEKTQINVKRAIHPRKYHVRRVRRIRRSIIIARLRLYFNFLGRPIVPIRIAGYTYTGITRARFPVLF